MSKGKNTLTYTHYMGFSGGSGGKESACKAGDLGLIPGLGRLLGGGHGNSLQYPCLENLHGLRILVGCSPWGCQELDATEQLSTADTSQLPHTHMHIPHTHTLIQVHTHYITHTHTHVCTYIQQAAILPAIATPIPPNHKEQLRIRKGNHPQPGRETTALSVLQETREQIQLPRCGQAGLWRGEISLIQKDESVLNLSR